MNHNQKQNYEISGFCDAYNVSRQTVYREIAKGRLKSYKVGRRRLISRQAGEEWQRRLEAEAEGGRPQPKRTYGAEARL